MFFIFLVSSYIVAYKLEQSNFPLQMCMLSKKIICIAADIAGTSGLLKIQSEVWRY